MLKRQDANIEFKGGYVEQLLKKKQFVIFYCYVYFILYSVLAKLNWEIFFYPKSYYNFLSLIVKKF